VIFLNPALVALRQSLKSNGIKEALTRINAFIPLFLGPTQSMGTRNNGFIADDYITQSAGFLFVEKRY